ncbi:MAG: diguanylate cyclase [Acidimicrobiales bacterium]
MDDEVGVVLAGVALQPLLGIGDRSTVGYEAVFRLVGGARPAVCFARALELVPVVNPAVLVVPATEALFSEIGDRLAELTAAAGVMPGELVWLLPLGSSARERVKVTARARWLTEMGFGLALDGMELAALADAEVAELTPTFAMLAQGLAERVSIESRARAEVSALMSYFGRLGTRTVARCVDDENTARLWLELGLQFGAGRFLQPPVVLEPGLAEPGDEIVNSSWFRQRTVRAVGRQDRDSIPVSFAALPRSTGPASDREFARFLGEAARTMQAEHDPRRILDIVAGLVTRVMAVDRLAIFEARWDSYTLRPRIVVGEGLEGLQDVEDLMGAGITGWAFLRGEPYNCHDTFAHEAAAHVPGSDGGRREESMVVIPLVAGDHRLGVLDVWRDGLGGFDDEDVERCALIGYLAAAAWRNARLYEELEQRVITDKLTGLLNKRWWDELAPREAAQALRNGFELAILLVDLDNFKLVNDSCGHAVGDLALRNTARVLASALRSGDAAVRFGGDEFLLVLHGAGVEGAQRVAEQVGKMLRSLPPACEGISALTASIGIATFPTHGSSLEDVVREADLAMYQAKAMGRDRIVVVRPS